MSDQQAKSCNHQGGSRTTSKKKKIISGGTTLKLPQGSVICVDRPVVQLDKFEDMRAQLVYLGQIKTTVNKEQVKFKFQMKRSSNGVRLPKLQDFTKTTITSRK